MLEDVTEQDAAQERRVKEISEALVEPLRRGESVTFKDFQADNPNADPAEFYTAKMNAEKVIINGWELGPEPRRITRASYDGMNQEQKTAFITKGGVIYDESLPEPAIAKQVIDFGGGRTITRGEWESLSPRRRAELTTNSFR